MPLYTISGAEIYTAVMGKAEAGAGQMAACLKEKNPSVEKAVLDMIPLYFSEGEAEGVRGDIAFAQSCLETGYFTFSGSAVTPGQNNFCGMGVTGNGMRGDSFDTPRLGIRAQVQHLKAYASMEALKNPCIDPRFRYVSRGCAPYVEWLGIQENPQKKGWASGAGYGGKILSILNEVLETADTEKEASAYTVKRNDTLWSIAASQLGSGRRYKEIKELNGLASDVIFTGQVLKLPE